MINELLEKSETARWIRYKPAHAYRAVSEYLRELPQFWLERVPFSLHWAVQMREANRKVKREYRDLDDYL